MMNTRVIKSALLVSALLVVVSGNIAWAEDGVVERPTYDPTAARKTVEFWEGKVKSDPSGAIALRELASAYLRLQRETGSIAYAVKAEKAARTAIGLSVRGKGAAWSRLASALLSQHRFAEALAAADEATALDSQAQRLRADILLELGRVDEAEKALATLGPESNEDPNRLALKARLLEARGDTPGAIAARREAARVADTIFDLSHETASWYRTMVGHALIDSGKVDEGERECLAALKIFPRDYRAITGLAEAAFARGQWVEARTQAERALAIAPENPEAVRMIYETSLKLKDEQQAKRAEKQFSDLAHSFPRIYDRHWVMFCADYDRNLDEAYSLAQQDLKLRQDARAHDTLAWVAFKKGLLEEARAQLKQASAKDPHDGLIQEHAKLMAQDKR